MLKSWSIINGLQLSSLPHIYVCLFKMACSYFLDDEDQFTVSQKIPCSFLCRLLVKMTIVSFLSLCFLVGKQTI